MPAAHWSASPGPASPSSTWSPPTTSPTRTACCPPSATPSDKTLADLLRRLLSSFDQAPTAVGAALGLQLESAPVARRRRQAVGLSDTAGLLVAGITAGGAAERAGLVRGDLVVEVDRVPTLSTVALAERLERAADGQRMRLTVLRGDERERVTVVNVS